MTKSKSARDAARKERAQDQTATQADMLAATFAAGTAGLMLSEAQAGTAAEVQNSLRVETQLPVEPHKSGEPSREVSANVSAEAQVSAATWERGEAAGTSPEGVTQSFHSAEEAGGGAGGAGSSEAADASGSETTSGESGEVAVRSEPHAAASVQDIAPQTSNFAEPSFAPLDQTVETLLDRAIETAGNAVQSIASSAFDGIAGMISGFQNAMSGLGNAVPFTAEPLLNVAEETFDQAIQPLTGLASLLGTGAGDDLSDVPASLLGAPDPAAQPAEALAETVQLAESLIPSGLGFIGQSYDHHEAGGLLHGFI